MLDCLLESGQVIGNGYIISLYSMIHQHSSKEFFQSTKFRVVTICRVLGTNRQLQLLTTSRLGNLELSIGDFQTEQTTPNNDQLKH